MSYIKTCRVCGKDKVRGQVISLSRLLPTMQDELILKYNIGASEEPFICLRDVTRLQGSYIKEFINNAHNKFHSVNPDIKKEKYEDITAFKPPQETPSTLGEKLSDKLAEFGGSWTFIGCFAFVMVTWISFNSIALLKGTFDPYPFILLNLVLSCLAAIQAPIIMMSQNRQEKKDRVRAESDYLVNVKAELEIRQLHSKLDMLLSQGS